MLETLMVVTIIAILFVALEPAYRAFQYRARLSDATDRTRQILERARTLAVSGYRTAGTQPDLLVIDIDPNRPEEQIRLCPQKFDPLVAPTPAQLKSCTPTGPIIDSVSLGTIRIATPGSATLIGFVPPFGTSLVTPTVVDIRLSIGTTAAARSSLVRFLSATNRIEVNPSPAPAP